jgi:hypothetical protein
MLKSLRTRTTVTMLLTAYAFPGFADSINPATYSATLAVGETKSLHKTVTITPSSNAPVDVFFLTDTTGSMGGSIAAVKTNFANIVTNISALASNVAYGVGEYKDTTDAFAYRLNTDITTNTATVQAGLNQYSASGGGDFPEANIYGLRQAATTTSFRAGSRRFLFWVGDAPGHDPSLGATEANAIAALQAADLTVYAINVGNLNATGQATRITAATGGSVLSGGYSEAADIIEDALTAGLLNYSLVELVVSGLGPGVDVTFTPASRTGAFDRSVARDFGFDVGFKGVTPGTYNFQIQALVDGGVVATETDSMTVSDVGGPVVPEPSTYLLFSSGFAALYALRRRYR